MAHRIIIRREAEIDITDAAIGYHLQQPGLGHEFLAEVDAAPRTILHEGSWVSSPDGDIPAPPRKHIAAPIRAHVRKAWAARASPEL